MHPEARSAGHGGRLPAIRLAGGSERPPVAAVGHLGERSGGVAPVGEGSPPLRRRLPAARIARRVGSRVDMTAGALAAPLLGGRRAASIADAARRAVRPPRTRFGAVALAALLAVLWLAIDPHTADFAAQAYRSRFFAEHGFALWDNHWFDGHLVPGYSLLFPPLGAVIGPRFVGAAAVVCSTAAFSVIAFRHRGSRSSTAACWFAAVAAGDLYIGRLTFALGVALGLLAVLSCSRGNRPLTALLAAACAAASPVAGLFLGVVAVCGWTALGPLGAALLGVPAVAVAGVMSIVFGDGGAQPFDLAAAIVDTLLIVLVAVCADGRPTFVRRGALLYACGIVLCFVVPSPIGSNVARLGVLLAGPLLIFATRNPRRPAVVAVCAGLVIWQLWGPVSEVAKTFDNPSTTAAYYAPLINYMERAGAATGRVEVVPTATRWESVYVAERFDLARGWETQLDERYNPLFYTGQLTAEEYRNWLIANGVRFVALPDVVLERWGLRELKLLRDPPPYLRLTWHNAHWRVFAVEGSQPLLRGPGRLLRMTTGEVAVRALAPGPIQIHVHYTRFLHPTGPACLSDGPGGWTILNASAPGEVDIRAQWSLSAALGASPACPLTHPAGS
jgi:hypothetical protein